jgi:hypothetical protein
MRFLKVIIATVCGLFLTVGPILAAERPFYQGKNA